MSQTALSALISGGIGIGTLTLSISSAFFIAGRNWGELRTKLETMQRDLSELRGMFVLTPKDHDK